MVTKRTDYTAEAVEAAYRVMLELTHLLGECQDGIVVIGGWVPELLLSGAGHKHVGSIDVDLALDHRSLGEAGYKTILQLLLSRGYQRGDQPFIFFRKVQLGEKTYEVEVDFLEGEYKGTGCSRRTQRVQDMQPRKARGCDLAFTGVKEVTVKGTLPEGGEDKVLIRVAAIAPFIVMKSMALASRLKEKDAWDIYYCIRNYPGGIDRLADEFHPIAKNKLTKEALEKLAEKFASPENVGPKQVADFEDITDPEERRRRQRDAYERVKALLEKLRSAF
ncbi:MAG: hypothetical protein ABSF99_10895 [Anaerolineales bacterium]|jgi:hypothetical protein